MDLIMAILMGVGLSSACGFRVFVPMLGVSLAANTGQLTLASGFSWMGSDLAVGMFGVATVLEIGAYYLPWLDNMMDSIASPAAVVAGAVAATASVSGHGDLMLWAIAAITGGGAAGTIQTFTVGTRLTSLATTGGVGNPVVSTVEVAAASTVSFLAVVAPLVMILFLFGFGYIVYRLFTRKRRRAEAQALAQTQDQDPPKVQPG